MGKHSEKRSIVIFLTIGLVIFVLIFFAIYLLGKERTNNRVPKYDFIFHEIDFDTDILLDPEYLALDRSVSLKLGNQTVTIDDGYRSENGTIEFMMEYLNCIIGGDYNSYKNFFSQLYFETENVPEIFTMQRVYETTIEIIGETAVTKSNKNYTEYRLSLDYKINRNDGTLRNDMGSDCFRTQYFLITNREGSLKIDTIKTFDIVDDVPIEINLGGLCVSCAVLFIVAVIGFVVIKKKRSAKALSDNQA